MRELPLSRGMFAFIDDEDWERVSAHKWNARPKTTGVPGWYAQASDPDGGTIYLHRFLMDAPDDLEVDHRDGNGLNNFRSNLRLATHSQNQINRAHRRNLLGARGVSIYGGHYRSKPYRARVWVQRKAIWGPYRATIEEAAQDRLSLAARTYGEFAIGADRMMVAQ